MVITRGKFKSKQIYSYLKIYCKYNIQNTAYYNFYIVTRNIQLFNYPVIYQFKTKLINLNLNKVNSKIGKQQYLSM